VQVPAIRVWRKASDEKHSQGLRLGKRVANVSRIPSKISREGDGGNLLRVRTIMQSRGES
jgi:methyl coenzyme M reductase alpha subunit